MSLLLVFDIAQWVSVVTAGITIVAVGAIARLLSSKADKANVDKDKASVDKELAEQRSDNKAQGEESLRQYRELRTAIEGIQKELTLLDKHSLTSNDLLDMKADIKEVIKGQAEAVKLIDGMPGRLTSLEATRNKQSEK